MKKTIKTLAIMMALVLTMAACLTACGSKNSGADVGADDGQNPVMNFIGFYGCDRATIYIGANGNDGAEVIVTWGSSAWENSAWVMSGTFHEETMQIEYHDCVRTDYVYDDDGEVKSQEEVYTGGHGFITFSEGDALTLTWQDDQEHMADGMVFEYGGIDPELEEMFKDMVESN